MRYALKFVATPLLILMFAAVNPASSLAQSADTQAAPDHLCDYCKDYTDAATSAGEVRSRYRPGTGYPAEPDSEMVAAMQRQRKETGFSTPSRPENANGIAR